VPTLHFYLIRQVLATLGLTLLVFTFVLLMGSVLRDILTLIAAGHASFGLILKAFLLLIPWVIAFALPIGLLSATLLVFGRISADNELTAIRASGIGLFQAVWPILALSMLLSAVSALFNCEVAPRCRWAFKELQMQTLRSNARDLLTGGKYLDFGSLTLFARDIQGGQMKDVLIYQVHEGRRVLDLWAPEGELGFDTNGLPSDLLLKNAQGLTLFGTNYVPFSLARWPTNLTTLRTLNLREPRITEMTWTQLREERRKHAATGGTTLPVEVQMHRQLSISLSCAGFALIGIPLGIRAHRRETNIGILLALLLLAAYYGLSIIAQSLQTRPAWHPQWLLWVPNLLFLGTGSWLLRRAHLGR
jgi:lipopolysaccharide export system permease protein